MNMFEKLKTIVSLKSRTIEILTEERDRAIRIAAARQDVITQLQKKIIDLEQQWWIQQDNDKAWIDEQLERIHAEELHGFDVPIDFDLSATDEAALAEMSVDIPWERED
jgi:hypothetical protein